MENQQINELAKLLKEGKKEVFKDLVNFYQIKIFKTALSITKSDADAEDITQETFIKILDKIENWKGENFNSWIIRIATNISIDFIRKRKVGKKYEKSMVQSPDNIIIKHEKNEIINEILKKLPPNQKEVIFLKHFKGLTIKEIAKTKKCAEGTVKATLYQTFQKLKIDFSKAGLMDFME